MNYASQSLYGSFSSCNSQSPTSPTVRVFEGMMLNSWAILLEPRWMALQQVVWHLQRCITGTAVGLICLGCHLFNLLTTEFIQNKYLKKKIIICVFCFQADLISATVSMEAAQCRFTTISVKGLKRLVLIGQSGLSI